MFLLFMGLAAIVAGAEFLSRPKSDDESSAVQDASAVVGQGLDPQPELKRAITKVAIPPAPGPSGRYQDPGLPLMPATRPTTVGGSLSAVTAGSLMSSPHLGGKMFGSRVEGRLVQGVGLQAEEPSPTAPVSWNARGAPVGRTVAAVAPVGMPAPKGLPSTPVTKSYSPTARPSLGFDSARSTVMSSAESPVGFASAKNADRAADNERKETSAPGGKLQATSTNPNPPELVRAVPKPAFAGLSLPAAPAPARGAQYVVPVKIGQGVAVGASGTVGKPAAEASPLKFATTSAILRKQPGAPAKTKSGVGLMKRGL